ncbi:unnamed protein product [Knipowitschia caucasica]|uniref:MSP domain-containing protein n=1 Tax=Knipowitschia caucasica TaxID=637954 RepID=A0AAV2LVV8_KNICA
MDSSSEPDSPPLPQVLELQPDTDLFFRPRPRDREGLEATLQLWNPSERPVYFKTMTSALGRCHVRPSRGLLVPGASTTILVTMRGLEAEPRTQESLMVLSMFCADPSLDFFSAWIQAGPEEVMRSVLKCKYDPGAEESRLQPRAEESRLQPRAEESRLQPRAEESRLQPPAETHSPRLRSFLVLLFILGVAMAIVAAYFTGNITYYD